MKIALTILFSLCASGDSCIEWFKKSKLDPQSKSCLTDCASRLTGMDTFGCELECHNFCRSTKHVWIYFGNGMFNAYDDASQSAIELNTRLNSLVSSRYPDLSELIANTSVAHVAYNNDENIFLQLLEVYIQKMGGDATFFFRFLSDISNAPAWFREAIGKLSKIGEILDSDLHDHIVQYVSHLKEGDGVIVVSHSQGSFYAIAARDRLGDPDRVGPQIEVNRVASPIQDFFTPYTNLYSDWLIRLLPNSSSPNVRNSPEGFFDHEFVKHYLNGNNSGPRILLKTACLISGFRKVPITSIFNQLDNLNKSEKHQSCIDVPG